VIAYFSIYALTTAHNPPGEDNVVVPLSLLPELRKLPDDVLSFPDAVEKVSGIQLIVALTALIAYRPWKSNIPGL
jgi:hypothetical protein